MRRSRRLTADVMMSLGAGVVVTVIVSWSLALHGDGRDGGSVEGAVWPGCVEEGWPERARFVRSYSAVRGPGGLRQWDAWGNHDGSHRDDYRMAVMRAGWPLTAMRSTLRKEVQSGHWSAATGPYDNDGTWEAGLRVPLHWARAHEDRGSGLHSRRLPLRPLALGFFVNTVLASAGVMALGGMWRLHRRSVSIVRVRRRWRWIALPLAIVAGGFLLNIGVAIGASCWWQFGPEPLRLSQSQWATSLRGPDSTWPARVPESLAACAQLDRIDGQRVGCRREGVHQSWRAGGGTQVDRHHVEHDGVRPALQHDGGSDRVAAAVPAERGVDCSAHQ